MSGLDSSQQVTDETVLKAGGEDPPKPVAARPDAAEKALQKAALQKAEAPEEADDHS